MRITTRMPGLKRDVMRITSVMGVDEELGYLAS